MLYPEIRCQNVNSSSILTIWRWVILNKTGVGMSDICYWSKCSPIEALVAFNKTRSLLCAVMRTVSHHCTAKAIEMVSKLDTVCCHPGSRRGNMEQVVAQWRHFVALWKPLASSIEWCTQYCTVPLPWLSKWPGTEVHSFVIATSFV